MQKKGWIRIVEAFTAILLVTGVLLVILNNGSGIPLGDETPKKIFEQEQGILRYIELNDSLRGDVIGISASSLPVSLEDFPDSLKNAISSRTPSYLSCDAMVCGLGSECVQSEGSSEEVYVQKTVISSSLSAYSPRELKLFCSMR